MNGWHNKTVYITGASSGIGLNLVEEALLKGAKVCAFFRTPNNKLYAQECDNLLLYQGDVTSLEAIEESVRLTYERFKTIDIVINNAGAMYYMDITKPDYQQMKTMIKTNCIGFINLVQAILPLLTKSEQGHWVNITSDAARRPFAGLAIYSGTKAFIEFSANAMRQELIEHNVKVTNIQPGNVATPLHSKSTDNQAIVKYATENTGQYLSAVQIINAINFAISTPHDVAINEILIEPRCESI